MERTVGLNLFEYMDHKGNRPTIVHYLRKGYANSFSVEFIFSDVRQRLSDRFNFRTKTLSNYSKGVVKRLFNMLEAVFYQGDVNHITGDTNYIACFLWKNRTVLTIHDCGFLKTKNALKRGILKLFWLTLPVRRAGYITAISETTKKDIVASTGIDPGRVIVIPATVSEKFKAVPREFNNKCPTLLQIGTTPNKNLKRLIPAIKDIKCRLVIIGQIERAEKDLLEMYKIQYQNLWNLTQEELVQQYVDCDIVTFASTFEGFGMPIIEANCVERPVLAGRNSSMIEVAGNAACLVDAESIEEIRNGILRIINDQEYRKSLIERGRENRMRFDPQKVAAQYQRLYDLILNKAQTA